RLFRGHPARPRLTFIPRSSMPMAEEASVSTPNAPSSERPMKVMRRDDMDFATLPNILTAIRVLVAPLVVWLLFQKTHTTDIIAAFTFGAAALTDYFDGYYARKMKVESIFGKLMDPLADKFLVVSCLCMLQELDRIHPVIVILLIC